MVYYRKYRPQAISELDLISVREKLTAVLSAKEVPHAFLFVGPRGLGKTSSARILAKALNCPNKKGIEPCNECDICESITSGNHIDVIEIDAASNRGVDEIRSLREKVKFSPSELSKKVYIIDEVHMLTAEAFNALLKTLEEPPEHVIFVLATTEAHKIPQTILSRVFGIKFESPTNDEIKNSLKRIAVGEKLKIDDMVFEKVASLSEGSFRDAAKILEELSLNSSGEITLKLVDKIFKTGSIEKLAGNLLDNFYKKDMVSGLKTIEQINSEGVDFRIVIEQMVESLRKDLLKEKGNIAEQKEILRLLNDAYAQVKISVIPQLPLELAIIEYSLNQEAGSMKHESRILKQEAGDKTKKSEENRFEVKQDSSSKPSVGNDFLKDLIDGVHKDDRRIAAFLRSCKEASVDGSNLILVTPYSLHAEKLSKQEFSELILKNAVNLNPAIKNLQVKTE